MSDIKEDALKKGLAEIWAALSSCSYGDISETMMTVSRAKAKCLALIDPKLLEMENDTLWWTLFGDAGVARMILGKKDHDHDLLNPEYMGHKKSPYLDEMVEIFAHGQNVLENPIMLYLVELNLWKNPYSSRLKSKERFFFNIRSAMPGNKKNQFINP